MAFKLVTIAARTPGTDEYYKHRHALCKPCKLFFTWRPNQIRKIEHARCTRCDKPLTRTTGANLEHLVEIKTQAHEILAVGEPRFKGAQR